MKILCVLLPHFPLRCEIRRHPEIEGHPAIVTYAAGSKRLVLDYSPELENLQIDMPLQQAISQYGEVSLIHADLPYYRFVFNEVLDALEEISPLVEGADLGLAYLGLDGTQLIYPDDNALAGVVWEALPEVFAAQMGIAEGKFLAYMAARSSPPGGYTTLPNDVQTFLHDLSCDVLSISLKSKSKLHDFGLHTLGQIAALDPGPLQAQFGPEGKIICDLARGQDDTPLYPRFLEEVIEESTTLVSVTVSLEALLVTFEGLLYRVLAKIAPRGIGLRGLTLWTQSWDGEHWEKSIGFKEPVTNIKVAISRIKHALEDSPQPGPVEQLGVKVTGLGYHRGRQKSLFTEVRAKDHLLDNIRQLEFRLGDPQVYQVKEVEPWSRIPERRYILAPVSR